MSEPRWFHYWSHDERIRSQREVDCLRPCEEGEIAWEIVDGEVWPEREGAWEEVHREEDFPGGPVLSIKMMRGGEEEGTTPSLVEYAGWRFLCEPERITCEEGKDTSVDFSEIVERVLSPWMVLTRRPGVLALHGGAVASADGSRAWVLMGESGAGKSTAALELVRRGMVLLSDDMALIDLGTGRVLPGVWVVRMWGEVDTTDPLVEGVSVIVGTRGGKHRVRLAHGEVWSKGVELAGLIALERQPSHDERGEWQELRGMGAMQCVLGQAFDLSAPPEWWSIRRMRLAGALLRGGVKLEKCIYQSSTSGEPAHVEGLWRKFEA